MSSTQKIKVECFQSIWLKHQKPRERVFYDAMSERYSLRAASRVLVAERVSVNSPHCYLPIAVKLVYLLSPALLLLPCRIETYLYRFRWAIHTIA